VSSLHAYLMVSAVLFGIGLAGVLTRRHAIVVLMGIELMLNAANLNFLAFWRHGPEPERLEGLMLVVFAVGVAAAEAAVGLALVIAVYRHFRSVQVDEMDQLRG
jgi:NADH:ubiquinone oxidoreductase subunit K